MQLIDLYSYSATKLQIHGFSIEFLIEHPTYYVQTPWATPQL